MARNLNMLRGHDAVMPGRNLFGMKIGATLP